MKERNGIDLNIDSIKNQLFLEVQRREIATEYLACALWEYNIEERCQYQYKKLDGKWMDEKTPIRNYRETVISWGLIHPDDLGSFNSYCDSLENGESDFSYEMRIIGDHDKFIKIRYTGKAIFDQSGKPVSVVGVTYDITDRLSRARSFDDDTDSLTGLLNHKCLSLMKIQFGELEYNESTAFIFIDVDDFKLINSKYGRSFGDYMLEQIGKSVGNCFPEEAIAGRLGGDQFAVMCYGFSDRSRVLSYIYDLKNNVKSKQFRSGVRASVSVGAVILRAGEDSDFSSAIRNAETALYIAKRENGDAFHLYESADENAMPPDCRQIKYFERFESRAMFDFSQLSGQEKSLFNLALHEVNSSVDFYTAAAKVFDKILHMYPVDSICLVHKFHNCPLSVPVMCNVNGAVDVPNGFEDHLNRHWNRICGLITANNPTFVCNDVRMLKDDSFFTDLNYKMNTKSTMICGIFDVDRLVGFVAIDSFLSCHKWSGNEIGVFSSVVGMISSYMISFLSKKLFRNEVLYSTAIMENKGMIGYTINPETYEITYATHRASGFFKSLKVGDICYKAIMGRNKPCRNCPAAMLTEGVDKHSEEIYNRYSNKWFSATASHLNSGGADEEYLVCLTDVTQFMDRVQSRDRLTGLMTFDKFELECTKSMDSFVGSSFVVVFKVIRFNEINDDFGFEVGNRVIREISSKLNRGKADDELICRSNGAHFFALLKADVIWKVQHRIKAFFYSLEDGIRKINPDIRLCMAAGIYEITPQDKQFNSCLDKANYAMKKITNGRFVNQSEIRTFDDEMNEELSARKEIERNMYSALRNGEFQVFYQPKVELDSEKIYGAEALVRWVKPNGEVIPPSLFVPIFEENEFIVEMDFYVYDVVLRDMRRLIDEGCKLPIISLNASRQHFLGDDFPDKFCRLVNKYKIPHECIELEITEMSMFNNVDHLIGIINNLRRENGFRISVDDFGSGYSSLNLISLLPVDVIKIDGKFFMSNEMTGKNKKVIETILQLASTLDFDTVSEGVETKEQIEFLKRTNCSAVQGYFYYRPMTFEKFKELMSK